jgi:type I restriction enzyme S subunit
MDKVRIGDICTVVSGSTPKSNIEEYWNGEIKWITPAEITDDSYVISDTERHITEKAVEKTNLTLLPVGAVLLSSRAPIGKTAIVGAEMYCNQGFKNLICSERIYNKYLYFFLTSKVDYLNALGRGATFKEISKGIVEDVEIPLPSLDEQKKIAERFEAIQQLISKRKQVLLHLDNLVKSRLAADLEEVAA